MCDSRISLAGDQQETLSASSPRDEHDRAVCTAENYKSPDRRKVREKAGIQDGLTQTRTSHYANVSWLIAHSETYPARKTG